MKEKLKNILWQIISYIAGFYFFAFIFTFLNNYLNHPEEDSVIEGKYILYFLLSLIPVLYWIYQGGKKKVMNKE